MSILFSRPSESVLKSHESRISVFWVSPEMSGSLFLSFFSSVPRILTFFLHSCIFLVWFHEMFCMFLERDTSCSKCQKKSRIPLRSTSLRRTPRSHKQERLRRSKTISPIFSKDLEATRLHLMRRAVNRHR